MISTKNLASGELDTRPGTPNVTLQPYHRRDQKCRLSGMDLAAAVTDEGGFVRNYQPERTLPGADIDWFIVGVEDQNQF